MKRIHTYMVAVFCVLAPCGAIAFFGLTDMQPELRNSSTGKIEMAAVLDIARERGIAESVAAVDRAVRAGDISSDECHSALHIIGHEAYIAYRDNLDSIFAANPGRICLGGYLHGVEAQMAAEGVMSKEVLWRLCEEMLDRGVANGPCFHGAGHGTFEYTHDVELSLAFCDALLGGPENMLWNCYRGIFSELANAIMGVDTNTGEAVTPIKGIGISREGPFRFCDSLAPIYRDACYTQLTKLFIATSDPVGSIARCEVQAKNSHGKRACIETLSGNYGRIYFDTSDIRAINRFIESLEPEDREFAIRGVRDAYNGYVMAGGLLTWKNLCDAFPVPAHERVLCEKMQLSRGKDGATIITL